MEDSTSASASLWVLCLAVCLGNAQTFWNVKSESPLLTRTALEMQPPFSPVDSYPETWSVNHIQNPLLVNVPNELVNGLPHHWWRGQVPPVHHVPLGEAIERVPYSQPVDLDSMARPYHQWLVPPAPPMGQFPQGQPVAQAPGVVQSPQARPVQFPVPQVHLKGPEVSYTRPLVRSVAAECKENSALVVVKRDLLGIGQLIQSSDVTLGGCAPTGQDESAGVLLFQTELQGCNGKLTMTADSLIYTFTLLYVPHPVGGAPIVRTNRAAVSVECRYLRHHNVSSSAIKPTWMPFVATKRSEDRLVFSLKLMSDDWQSERTSNTYFLGDLINVEASVSVGHHVPLRVFVDGCVATLVPDVKAIPRYSVIENHGCLVDARLTGSRSQFMHRRLNHKLQFQLDAFRFSGDPRSSIYLTCLLKATPASATTNLQYKACSFLHNRWVAANGNDHVCGCCDASCTQRKGRSLDAATLEQDATLGPLFIHETPSLEMA